MKILVGCEYSGAVRNELRAIGQDAWSCDLLPSEDSSPFHIQCDVLNILNHDWDMAIFFPPCTDLCVSGAKHFARKRADGTQQRSINFFMRLANAPIQHIAIENPVGIMSTEWRKPDQIIQPWQFGHPHTKSTCLWLKNLPELQPTNVVSKGERHITKSGKSLPEWYNLPPSEDRWKIRSRTFSGIAAAMANQWIPYLLSSPPTSRHANAATSRGVRYTQCTLPIANA